jgi:type II secretory pathway component GspD/PulD (secretin)
MAKSMRRNCLLSSLLLILAVCGLAQAQETVLEVIDLNYRSADQIVPLLKPLLAPGGTISAIQNRVIVRTTPENLAQLRKVLTAVDTRPKRLAISVRQQTTQSASASAAQISGSTGADGARVTVPGDGGRQDASVEVRNGQSVVRARASSSQSATTGSAVQTLQVLEGNEAVIRVGQSVPVRSRSVTRTPQGTQISETVEYRNADVGLRVRPRVQGNQVTLEISTRNDAVADASRPTFDVQRVDTVVSGRLGQWLEVGGIDQNRVQSDNALLNQRNAGASDERKIFLKVEELP